MQILLRLIEIIEYISLLLEIEYCEFPQKNCKTMGLTNFTSASHLRTSRASRITLRTFGRPLKTYFIMHTNSDNTCYQ